MGREGQDRNETLTAAGVEGGILLAAVVEEVSWMIGCGSDEREQLRKGDVGHSVGEDCCDSRTLKPSPDHRPVVAFRHRVA